MDFYCDMCGKKLEEPGALAFSPPNTDGGENAVIKWHICVYCWGRLSFVIDNEDW